MTHTPNEIKKGLECCAASYVDCHRECPYKPDCDGTQVLKDAIAYIQQLEAQVPRWISVEERMPEHGESVAAIIRYTEDAWDVVVGYVLNGEWYTAGHTPGFPITHWMPLPEAPEMKEETP